MTVPKLHSTQPKDAADLCRRVSDQPLIQPSYVVPSDPRLSVVGVLNPAFVYLNGQPSLIVRVDERPIRQGEHHSSNGKCKTIDIAYLSDQGDGRFEITTIEVPGSFDPDRESILPDSVRRTGGQSACAKLYLSFMSHLRIATIHDDTITVRLKPAIFPSDKFSQYGCEDPRAVNLDGIPYVTFSAIGRFGATTGLAILSDSGSVESKKFVLGPDHKHSALFPCRVNEEYMMLTRPLTRLTILQEGIWSVRGPDLLHWGAPSPLLLPRPNMWDCERVGPGASPLRIPEGWLLFYYGVDKDQSYHLGAALLDGDDPSRVVARSPIPVQSPILAWEKNGRRADTVFPCGAQLLRDQETLRIYYGASDSCIGAADISISILSNVMIPTGR